jgi:hypothetical protein
MKLKSLFIAALIGAAPLWLSLEAGAAPKSEQALKNQRAQKSAQNNQNKRAVRPSRPARGAFAYRNHPWPDPSFDRSGRPYRPNFYSPCTVDLGYGRFASCDSWND